MLLDMTASVALLAAFLPLPAWAFLGILTGLYSPKKMPPLFAAGLLAGLGAVACAVSAQLLASPFVPPSEAASALTVALTEELARAAAVGAASGFAVRSFARDGDRSAAESARKRVLAFGLFVGLAFFAFESLYFAVRSPESLLYRLAWTLPLHGSAGVLAATRFAAAAPGPGKRSRGRSTGIVLAIAFHGAWNFLMSPTGPASPAYRFLALLVLLSAVFTAFLYWNAVPEGGE